MRPVLVCLLFAVPAAADVDELKKSMPKDQAAFIEKIDAHKDLQRKAKREPNDLKRGEYARQVRESERALADELSRKLAAGLKDWVGEFVSGDTRHMQWTVPDYIQIDVDYATMPEAVKDVARELTNRDRLTITTAGVRVKVEPIARAAAGATTVGASVPGKAVKSLAKSDAR